MNEASATSRLMSLMRDRGYLVRKIHGTLESANMPDLYACKNGVTVFFEVKLIKTNPPDAMRIPLKVDSQMIMMQDHDLKARARYLFIFKNSRKTWVMCLDPTTVRHLAESRDEVDVHKNCKEESSWLREELPRLFDADL
jgi:Holliday junction resolvase